VPGKAWGGGGRKPLPERELAFGSDLSELVGKHREEADYGHKKLLESAY
jgi:hypothetical protein